MARPPERPPPEDLVPELTVGSIAWLVVLLATGGALGLAVLPYWLPGLDQSLRGEVPHAPWYICRASGMVAFALLWASSCSGLLISARVARDLKMTPVALDLHQHLALTALTFAALHAAVLLADQYIGFGWLELVFPFSTRRHRPFAMGLGQIALYLALVATASFYLRRDLGKVAWRTLHIVGSTAFVLALIHGVFSGSSSEAPATQAIYWLAAGTALLLLFYRLLSSRLQP